MNLKGVRFYEEFTNTKKTVSAGNCCMVYPNTLQIDKTADGGAKHDAIVAIFSDANSPVCLSTVSVDFLRKYCKRVKRDRAREVHPELFKYIDNN